MRMSLVIQTMSLCRPLVHEALLCPDDARSYMGDTRSAGQGGIRHVEEFVGQRRRRGTAGGTDGGKCGCGTVDYSTGANGHWYEFVSAPNITWTDASNAVGTLGAGWHLATITSAEEQIFVNALLPAVLADRSHFWLGGSDAANEGTWTWVTGETFAYTNWWGGEPNNQGGENYLTLDFRTSGGDTKWNDLYDYLNNEDTNTWMQGYIIERPAPSRCPQPRGCCCRVSSVSLRLAAGVGRRRRSLEVGSMLKLSTIVRT